MECPVCHKGFRLGQRTTQIKSGEVWSSFGRETFVADDNDLGLVYHVDCLPEQEGA